MHTPPPHLTRITDSEGYFLGSGLLISPDHVLTCWHVVSASAWQLRSPSAPHSGLRVETRDGGIHTSRDITFATDESIDLAAIRLATPAPTIPPALLVSGLGRREALPRLMQAELEGWGYHSSSLSPQRTPLQLTNEPTMTEERDPYPPFLHLPRGPMKGMSGGPLTCPLNRGSAPVVGVMNLGGEDKSIAVAVSSDVALRFLARVRIRARAAHAHDALPLAPAGTRTSPPRTIVKTRPGFRAHDRLGYLWATKGGREFPLGPAVLVTPRLLLVSGVAPAPGPILSWKGQETSARELRVAAIQPALMGADRSPIALQWLRLEEDLPVRSRPIKERNNPNPRHAETRCRDASGRIVQGVVAIEEISDRGHLRLADPAGNAPIGQPVFDGHRLLGVVFRRDRRTAFVVPLSDLIAGDERGPTSSHEEIQ